VGSCRAFSARITVPPTESGRKISNTDRSNPMEVEASTPANCSRVKTCAAHANSTVTLACWIATPFGRPVEPDV
jgi:hypothetical protein